MPKARDRRARRGDADAGQARRRSPSASRTSSPAASTSASRSPARSPRSPKVLLLDEPLGALDKKLREETQFELIDLQQKLGLTFVIVTHDQEEAMTVADRIAVMDHGQIVQVATPAEIYEQPNSRYVADFIGDINLLEGRIAGTGRPATVAHGLRRHRRDGRRSTSDRRRPRATPPGSPSARRRSRSRSTRPPRPRVNASPARSGTSAISATCRSITCGWRPARRSRRPSPTARASSSARSRWDDKVWLTWSRDAGVVLTQ